MKSTFTTNRSGSVVANVISSIPDFILAGVFWYTWLYPEAIAENMPAHLVAIFLLEFVIIHSSAFMLQAVYARRGNKKLRLKVILGFGAFYSMFTLGFALSFKSWFPLIAFWGLTLNRIMTVLVPRVNRDKEMQKTMGKWALATTLYLCGAFLTIFLPIPRLGIEGSLMHYGISGGGGWYNNPEGPIAIGGLYFFLLGVWELYADQMIKKWSIQINQ
jgi:hypothetical protein